MNEAFEGSPWGAEPTEEWNSPPNWDSYYRLLESDPERRTRVIHRQVDHLIRILIHSAELPRQPTPQTLLDAGCGIGVVPHILAFWGFQVAAIDSCLAAVEAASRLRPSEEDLALCVPIWEPCKDMPGFELVEDQTRSLQSLRSYHVPGGSVEYIVGDWFSTDLGTGEFGVVYCRSSLRCSTKPYWRRSLRRFHELLSPGGVLLLDNVNAIGIRDEVEELLVNCGFMACGRKAKRDSSHKYVVGVWPTG